MSWPRALPWLVLFCVLAVLVARGRDGEGPAHGDRAAGAVVTRVVDGDTVHVSLHGRDETVRYIGMDTPETKKPGTPIQCFGPAASAADERLVAGQPVVLRFDAERRDRYGRLLAYVYRRRDGLFVNAELVRQGYARPLEIPPNTAHAGEFARLADRARGTGRGLWKAC